MPRTDSRNLSRQRRRGLATPDLSGAGDGINANPEFTVDGNRPAMIDYLPIAPEPKPGIPATRWVAATALGSSSNWNPKVFRVEL